MLGRILSSRLPARCRRPAPCVALAMLALLAQVAVAQEPASQAPPTRQDNFREVLHGVEIVDPYRWLEDQDSPETRQWIDAQNRYTHSLLDGLPSRPLFQKRLSELMRIDTVNTPLEQGGRYFLFKKAAGDDLPILYVRKGLNGKDEVLIDPHTLSPDHTTSVDLDDATSDGRLILYSIRRGGTDETELRVMDVDGRQDLADRLPTALYRGVSFRRDGSGFYYNLQKRDVGTRIFYHALGTDPAKDVEVFGKGYGPDKWVGASVSDDNRYLLFGVQHGWAKNELYVQEIAGGPLKTIVNDVDAHFSADFAGDRLVLRTDWQAPNGRILVVDLKDPARDKWREIVPEGRDTIAGFTLAGGKLFVSYLHNVASQIKVFTLDGKAVGEVQLPGLGAADLQGRWNSNEAFVSFRSYVTPPRIYRYDVPTGALDLWEQPKVPFDSDRFAVEQVWYPSKDGTRIPMFLVHGKDVPLDGSVPYLLTGYGGFDISQTPYFSTSIGLWI